MKYAALFTVFRSTTGKVIKMPNMLSVYSCFGLVFGNESGTSAMKIMKW